MNKVLYLLLLAGPLCLLLGCVTFRPGKLPPEERSSQPAPSAQPVKAKTLAIVVKTDPNLMHTYSIRKDTLNVFQREPLTDEEKRALALRVEDGLALPFENTPVFKRVEKQTALQGPSGPYGTDYVLMATIETIRPRTIRSYRSSLDRRRSEPRGVALHARLLDETGREIWQLSDADGPRTLWPPRRRSDYEQPFDEWGRPRWGSGSSHVEGQIHRTSVLSILADEIYGGVMQAIVNSR